MHKELLLMARILLLSIPSMSQEFKRVEVLGGFQFAHLYSNENGKGWNAAVTGNITHWIGITGDFSGTTILVRRCTRTWRGLGLHSGQSQLRRSPMPCSEEVTRIN